MRVNYKGCEKDFDYRLAEISYSEEEENLFTRVMKLMNIRGWEINDITDGYASCKIEDKLEYKYFMEDWKLCKKCIINCEKFGF